MGTSAKKRVKKIYSKNRANKVKNKKIREENNKVIKNLGYHKMINAELKTHP